MTGPYVDVTFPANETRLAFILGLHLTLLAAMLVYWTNERFHSRDQQPYWITETKESICIKIEFTFQRISLVHHHGPHFFVLEHQHGRRDVMWKRSIVKKCFGNLAPLLCKTRATFCFCFVHQHGRLITWLIPHFWAYLNKRSKIKIDVNRCHYQMFTSHCTVPKQLTKH